MPRRAATLLLTFALVALIGVGWRRFGSPDAAPAPLQRSDLTEETPGALSPAAITPGASGPRSGAPGSPVTEPAPRVRVASVSGPGRAATGPDETGPRATAFHLDVQFIGPDGYLRPLESVDVELRLASGEVRRASGSRVNEVRILDVEAGEAQLLVHAPGHSHSARLVALDPHVAEADRDRVRVQTVTTTVWPMTWIAVKVETPTGAPFTELAVALGLRPQPLFSNAFRARVATLGPTGGDPAPVHDPALAWFRAAPGQNAYVIDERAIGSLQLLRDPPLFVGLELYGAVLRWVPLAVNEREVRFVLSESELVASLARVELVVVEDGTRVPIPGARAALRADSSAARRQDHTEATSAGDGSVVFTHIVPGRYELSIERGDAQHQDYIVLARGERRDLGRIGLGPDVGIEVEVVDGNGAPAHAYVEVGVYAPGLRPNEMFPQMLRHNADHTGRVRVPSRSGRMVVRAAVEVARTSTESAVQDVYGARSPHVVVDPQELPKAPIRLVLAEPIRATIVSMLVDTARIDVLDSSDVVVARKSGAREVTVDVLPGLHRVRLYDSSGARLREVAVELVVDEQRVQVD